MIKMLTRSSATKTLDRGQHMAAKTSKKKTLAREHETDDTLALNNLSGCMAGSEVN
jgi:hypothetical protein